MERGLFTRCFLPIESNADSFWTGWDSIWWMNPPGNGLWVSRRGASWCTEESDTSPLWGDHGPLQEPSGSLGHSTPKIGPQHRCKTRGQALEGTCGQSLCCPGLQDEVLVSASLGLPSPVGPRGSYCPCPAPDLEEGLSGAPAGDGAAVLTML